MVPVSPPTPLAVTSLAVRWVHVLGMALALGGALLTWTLLRRTDSSSDLADTTLTVASTYERLFWGAAGLLVMTGVGNLGALAPSLPVGEWAATLTEKLLLVGVLLVGSLVRSFLVVEARRTAGFVASETLQRSYAVTVVVLGLILVLAEVLAHG